MDQLRRIWAMLRRRCCRMTRQVGGRFIRAVGGEAWGLIAQIVAPLVGGAEAITGGGQRGDLLPPAVGEFWEAVQEDDQRAVLGAGLEEVKANAVGFDALIVQWASLKRGRRMALPSGCQPRSEFLAVEPNRRGSS
jgi:hypothetical protein